MEGIVQEVFREDVFTETSFIISLIDVGPIQNKTNPNYGTSHLQYTFLKIEGIRKKMMSPQLHVECNSKP